MIALPGDTVQPLRKKDTVVPIPAGHVWVEGDEAFHSRDSNSFGTVSLIKTGCLLQSNSLSFKVPIGLINAKVNYILWPLSRFGPVEKRPVNEDRVKMNVFKPGRDE